MHDDFFEPLVEGREDIARGVLHLSRFYKKIPAVMIAQILGMKVIMNVYFSTQKIKINGIM